MSEPDFSKPAPNFESGIKRLTDRVVSARVIANAIVEGQEAKRVLQTMSVLDKLDMVNQRFTDFEKSLDEKAQKLLDRHVKAEQKADRAFEKHNLIVDAREKKFDEMEAAVDRLSNSGNSPSSSGSSTGA